jgi:hypothetical protein
VRWIKKIAHPRRRGFWVALALNLVIALLCSLMASWASFKPSEGFLQSLAQIGATLLIAYAVETGWFVKATTARGADHDWWLGFMIGTGAAGLGGIGLALGLSERLIAGHWIWADKLLFGWSLGSLTLLGCLIVSLPDLSDAWTQKLRRGTADDD